MYPYLYIPLYPASPQTWLYPFKPYSLPINNGGGHTFGLQHFQTSP